MGEKESKILGNGAKGEWTWVSAWDLDCFVPVDSTTLKWLLTKGGLKGRRVVGWGGWREKAQYLHRRDVRRIVKRWPQRGGIRKFVFRASREVRPAPAALAVSAGIAWVCLFPHEAKAQRIVGAEDALLLELAFEAWREWVNERVDLGQEPSLGEMRNIITAGTRAMFRQGLERVVFHERCGRVKVNGLSKEPPMTWGYTDIKRLVRYAGEFLEVGCKPYGVGVPAYGKRRIDMRIAVAEELGGYMVQLPGQRGHRRIPFTTYRPHNDLRYLRDAREMALRLWTDDGMRPRAGWTDTLGQDKKAGK